MIAKFNSSWQDPENSPVVSERVLSLASRRVLDQLLALQMRLELATGVPVAIYGPSGQLLPGISPAHPRARGTLPPIIQNLLAPQGWPQRAGQIAHATYGTNLHFFITPVLLDDQPAAQVVLGPIQFFDPGAQEDTTARCNASCKEATNMQAPVLPSWRAQAIAGLASAVASTLSAHPSANRPGVDTAGQQLAVSNQETIIMPLVGRGHHSLAERPARLNSLAADANLSQRPITGAMSESLPPEPPSRMDDSPTAHQQGQDPTKQRSILPIQPQSPSSFAGHAPTETERTHPIWLATLIECMPQAIIVGIAPTGQIVLANHSARQLWPDLLGELAPDKATRTVLNADNYPTEWMGLRLALRQDAPVFRSEVSLELAGEEDPSRRPHSSNQLSPLTPQAQQTTTHKSRQHSLLVSAFPLRNAQGVTTHAVAIFEDLSSLIERELFKDELLLVAAHDMRNPLTVISSYTQLLERHLAMEMPPSQGLERARSRLNEIQEQVHLLTELSNQLHTITRLLSAQQRPRWETINLARLIQRAALDQQLLTPGRSIETIIEQDPCPVLGDPSHLQQIIMHLVNNAVRYTHPTKPIRLSLRCTPENSPLWAEISVRDQGIGIPRANLPHLFERFYHIEENDQRARAAGIPKPKQENILPGLGLYLCKQLIEHMGGRIWVDSIEGLGTTVSFTVPLKR